MKIYNSHETKNKRWKKINNHTCIVLSNLSTEKKLRKNKQGEKIIDYIEITLTHYIPLFFW